jgi:hypothetical protein
VLAKTSQGAKCALWWALVAYALIMTIAALQPVRQAWDEIFGPNDAQLIIVSAAPIRNVSVIYDGRSIVSRPDWPTNDLQGYAAFPAMRTRLFEPVLSVSWDGPDGARSVSRVMRQADSGRVCLYVLNIDSAGVPVSQERLDALSPFWWTCYSR